MEITNWILLLVSILGLFLVVLKIIKKRAVKKFDRQQALRERERQTFYFYDEDKKG